MLVPSVQASAGGRVVKKPHIGDFVQATFVVPQNPVRRNLATGMMGLGGGMGCGCGTPDCGASYNPYGPPGSRPVKHQTWAQQPSFVSASVPNWMLYGGAAVAAWFHLPTFRCGVSGEAAGAAVAIRRIQACCRCGREVCVKVVITPSTLYIPGMVQRILGEIGSGPVVVDAAGKVHAELNPVQLEMFRLKGAAHAVYEVPPDETSYES